MDNYLKLKEVIKNKWIEVFKNEQPHQLIEKLKEEFGEDAAWLFTQLKYREKLKDKLPLWYEMGCGISAKSIEQCSSQATATFKSTLISGVSLLDLCGGLGVDDVYFSKRFQKVTSLDSDKALNNLVVYNNSQLEIRDVDRKTTTAEDFLVQNKLNYDWIYADADRRDKSGRKIKLESSSPDILSLLPIILSISSNVLLKLSPMVDLTELKRKIPFLKSTYVISKKNEVKEILAIIEKNYTQKPDEHAVSIDETGNPIHHFTNTLAKPDSTVSIINHQQYIYEPDVALAKSGLWPMYAETTGLELLSKQSVYALSYKDVESFFGRKFICKCIVPFGKKDIKAYLLKNQITKANITRKNFVLKVDEIRQLFKLDDGGETYLFFTADRNGKKIMLHGVKP